MFSLKNQIKLLRLFKQSSRFPLPKSPYFFTPLQSFTFSTAQSSSQIITNITQGLSLLQQNSVESAKQQLQKILDEESSKNYAPENQTQDDNKLVLQAYYELGQIYEQYENQAMKAYSYYIAGQQLAENQDLATSLEYGKLNRAMGRLYLSQKQFDDAQDYLDNAENIFKHHKDQANLTQNTFIKAILYEQKGELAKAIEVFQDLLGSQKNLDVELVYQHLGLCQCRNNEKTEGLKNLNKSLEICIEKFGEVSEETLRFSNDLVHGLLGQGEAEQAVTFAEKSLEISKKFFEKTDPNLLNAYFMVGPVYLQTKQYKKALELFQEALDSLNPSFDQYHAQKAHICMSMASIHLFTGDQAKANSSYDEAMKSAIEFYGEKNPMIGDYYTSWGNQLRAKGEHPDNVVPYYSKAFQVYKECQDIDKMKLIEACVNIGNSAHAVGDLETALGSFQAALDYCLKGDSNPKVLKELYEFIASLYFQQGNLKEAFPNFLKTGEAWLLCGDAFGVLNLYYEEVAAEYENQGCLEEAVKLYNIAVEVESENPDKKSGDLERHIEKLVAGLEKLGRAGEAENIKKKYLKK